MAAAGAPILDKGGPRLPGTGEKTSIASKYLSDAFPKKLGTRLPAPTLANPASTTNVVGRLVGRWVPWVGWGLMAYDLTTTLNRFDQYSDADLQGVATTFP